MTLILSLYNLSLPYSLPNLAKKLYSEIISWLASIITIYSASVIERDTIFCSLQTQLTVGLPNVKIYLVILLTSRSLVKSESTYLCSSVFAPPKHNILLTVPNYLRIYFIAFQWILLGLLIHLRITLTASNISDLVQIMTYIRLPTVEAY